MFPVKVRVETCHEETTVMGLSCSEDHTSVARVILMQCRRMMEPTDDRRRDGQQLPKPPKNSLPQKFPYPQIVAFYVQAMLTHCENIFLL